MSAQTVDVLHYWTSTSESAAINALADAYKSKGGTWIDSPAANFDQAIALANSRIAGGQLPSAMVTNPGSTIDEMAQAGYMRDLTTVAQEQDWASFLPPHVMNQITVDDQVIAVPLGLHGANWLWYNDKIFKELNLKEPKTFQELMTYLKPIADAGYVPIAVGGENWQINYVMAAIISGLGGGELYQKLYVEHDSEAAQSPVIIEAFGMLREIQGYVDDGSAGRSWNETTSLLMTDRAAMQFMGDYVTGEFKAAGLVAGQDIGCMLVPGSEDTYQVLTDLMAFTEVDTPDVIAGQDLLIEAALDPAVELNISKAKGSTPPRMDAPVEELNACIQMGSAALKGNVVAAPYEALTADQTGQLSDLVGQFWSDESMSAEDAASSFAAIFN